MFENLTFNILNISVLCLHIESITWVGVMLANNSLLEFINNNDSKLSCVKQLLKRVFIILSLENFRSHVT
jgi:hypothetical protein